MSRLKSAQPDTSSLPRWLREPWASDFATSARLEYECTSGDAGHGLAAFQKPTDRLAQAVKLAGYGDWDHWPTDSHTRMHWPGRWRVGKEYDPGAFEIHPDGPPAWLREAVDLWQQEEDEAFRALLWRNGWLRGDADQDAAVLRMHGVPPEPL